MVRGNRGQGYWVGLGCSIPRHSESGPNESRSDENWLSRAQRNDYQCPINFSPRRRRRREKINKPKSKPQISSVKSLAKDKSLKKISYLSAHSDQPPLKTPKNQRKYLINPPPNPHLYIPQSPIQIIRLHLINPLFSLSSSSIIISIIILLLFVIDRSKPCSG